MATRPNVKQLAIGAALMVSIYGMAYLIGLAMGFVVLYNILRKGPKIVENKQRKRPACLDDPSLGEHGIVQLQDVKIHYVANGNKDKPLMLCLHGFPEFWYSWRYQLREFSTDYRVVAIDMRGYGESDKPRRRDSYHLKHLVEDINQLLPALGYESCVLMGHDWGGVIAWAVATRYPELVDQLVILNAPHPNTFVNYALKNKSQIWKSWYFGFFQVPRLPELILTLDDMKHFKGIFTSGMKSGNMTSEDLDAYVYNFSSPRSFRGPIHYFRATLLPFLWRQFGFHGQTDKTLTPITKVRVPKPTVMIWGASDSALDIALAVVAKRHVDELTVRYVDGAGHFVQMDQPDKVNYYIKLFLDDNKRKGDINDDDSDSTHEIVSETDVNLSMEETPEANPDPHVQPDIQESFKPKTEPLLEPDIEIKPEPYIAQSVEASIQDKSESSMASVVEASNNAVLSQPGCEPTVQPAISDISESNMTTAIDASVVVKSEPEIQQSVTSTIQEKSERNVNLEIESERQMGKADEPIIPDKSEPEMESAVKSDIGVKPTSENKVVETGIPETTESTIEPSVEAEMQKAIA